MPSEAVRLPLRGYIHGCRQSGIALARRKHDGAPVFRHRRDPGACEHAADDRRDCAEGRHGGRQGAGTTRRPPAARRDRQGYPPLRLHDRERADVRLHGGRRRCLPARPDADAGRGDADPVAARRHRRHDLGVAQSVRRQRHQAVRRERLQAVRRGRNRDRGADRCAGGDAAGAVQRIGRATRIESAQERYIEFAKRTLPRNLRLDGMRIVDRLRQRRRLQGRAPGAMGARRRSHPHRCRAERSQHQREVRLDGAGVAAGQGPRAQGRYRHRARRRCRSRRRRRREGEPRRWRPAAGGHRRELAAARSPARRRCRRNGDVEPRARAVSQRRSA